MNESNALLVEQFRQRDENAFAKLVGRHHSLVFCVCLRILGHRQDAEDVTQETFSRVARYLDRWDSRRPFEPWLVAIAGNRCRSFLATRRPHQPLWTVAEPAVSRPCQQHAADSLYEEVNLGLSQLPENQRRAFVLFHEFSLSYGEIAQQLDAPVGTIKTWVHRARSRLIDHLQQRNVIQPPRSATPASNEDASSGLEVRR